MNFLAHMELSFMDEEVLIGNFMADFINNKVLEILPAGVVQGIMLHRFIDSYTDQHPVVRSCTEILRPSQRKYAPVVADVLFDYILSTEWENYSDVSFETLKSFTYRVLLENQDVMPSRVRERSTSMINGDFLSVYGNIPGLRDTFRRISMRTSFEDNLDIAVDVMLEHIDFFKEAFAAFYPELKREAKAELNRLQS